MPITFGLKKAKISHNTVFDNLNAVYFKAVKAVNYVTDQTENVEIINNIFGVSECTNDPCNDPDYLVLFTEPKKQLNKQNNEGKDIVRTSHNLWVNGKLDGGGDYTYGENSTRLKGNSKAPGFSTTTYSFSNETKAKGTKDGPTNLKGSSLSESDNPDRIIGSLLIKLPRDVACYIHNRYTHPSSPYKDAPYPFVEFYNMLERYNDKVNPLSEKTCSGVTEF